jgi:hypothetical protein
MNQLIILEKIAIIEKAIEEIKASVSQIEIEETSNNVVYWDKGLRDNTKSLVLTLIKKYGNNKIQRNSNYLKNLLWDYRVTDLAQLLKTLEERNFCKIEYIAGSNRIEHFSFIQP